MNRNVQDCFEKCRIIDKKEINWELSQSLPLEILQYWSDIMRTGLLQFSSPCRKDYFPSLSVRICHDPLAEVVVYLFTLSLGALLSSLPTLINIVAGDG